LKSRIETLSSRRALLTGIVWNGAGRGIPIIVAVLATPILLHHLGIDRWALFTLALSIAGSFGILDFGVGAALTRALAERIGTPEESEAAPLIVTALTVLILAGCGGGILGYLCAPVLIDDLLNVPPALRLEAIRAFQMLVIAAPLVIANGALWGILVAYQKFRLTALVSMPVSVMYYLGPMAVLLAQDSLVWVIAAVVVARFLQTLTGGALVLRLVPELRRRPRFKPRLLRELLRIGVWVTISGTVGPLMLYLDRFIVGAMLSLAAVSYYATPLDLMMRLMMVPMAVAAALFPALATSHRTMPERAQGLLRTGSLVTILTVFPACLLMAGLAGELLSFWLGSAFAEHSRTVLIILGLGMFLNCVIIVPSTLIDAIGRPRINALIVLGQAILFVPVIVLLSARYGVTGAALAWTLRAAIGYGARLLVCRGLGNSVAPAVPALFFVALFGTAALIACPLIGPLPARLIVMAVAIVMMTLIAGLNLLRRDESAWLLQVAQKFLPCLPMARKT
jgi:O-antigen/teichoic acid export membrane protein